MKNELIKIFVPQNSPGKNLVPAQKHGELIFLLEDNEQVNHTNRDALFKQLRAKIYEHSTSPDDCILAIGDPILCCMTTEAFIEVWRSEGSFNDFYFPGYLKWDRIAKDYIKVPSKSITEEERE